MLRIFTRPWIILSVLIAFVSLSFVAYQILVNGCLWRECAPKRSFSELDLNLPDNLFPIGAEVHALHYLRSDTSTDPAISTNFWKGGTSIYRVQKSATESQAVEEYDFSIKSESFTSPLDDQDIKKHSAVINYASKVADESNLRCGYVIDDFRCIFVARYNEFTISFMSSIGDKTMMNDDYLRIIRYIDQRMDFLLKGGPS